MTAVTGQQYFTPLRGPAFITDLYKHTTNYYANQVHTHLGLRYKQNGNKKRHKTMTNLYYRSLKLNI